MRGPRSAWALLALLPTALLQAAEAPDVLLVTVDTLRPDALGWVRGDDATPHVDRLAREGFAFARAVSPVPLTLPAHSSLLTGLVPPRHGVRDNGQLLGAAPRLISESFAGAGYATAAFVSGYPLARPFGLARGFDHYDDALPEGEGQWLERRAPETAAAALEWLRQARRPWFVWVHFYDPHLPYDPPGAGTSAREVRGGYDAEVGVVDGAIGTLLNGLAGSVGVPGIGGPRLTVFAADHGESLGEHGEASHGYFVYDSTVAVPVVFHYPGVLVPGSSSLAPSLVDVAPTVLDLVGLPALPDVDGVSLRATLEGRSQELAPAYFESFQPWTSYGWAPLRGVRLGDWKWIAAPTPELYRLDEDPGEAANLYPDNVAHGRALHRELREILDRGPVVSTTAADDPEVLAKLRALGYLGAGAAPGEPPAGLPDPKDRLELRGLLTEGQELLDAGAAAAALAKFDAALATEPGNPFALSRSGFALLRLGRAPEAVERLRSALENGPEQVETRALLAEALGRAGDWPAAAGEWMEVVRRQPAVARNWSNLGAALGRGGQVERAVEALARAAGLDPAPDRLGRLAFAEFAAGRLEDAAGHLEEAARAAGEAFPHAGALGILLQRLDRPAEALPWLSRARPAEPEFGDARLALARIEMAAGRRESARRALEEALAAKPALRPEAQGDPLLAPLLADG